MAGDPPHWLPWCDALGYMPWMAGQITSLDQHCTQCGARIGDHIIGGPGPYHPGERPALWFWENSAQ